jgi:DNA-binding MarR family transcriptional regulator
MAKVIATPEYQALAEMRYRIRKFVHEGDAVASAAGLEPQQYLLLLMIRGIPEGQEATVSNLAERLVLIDRLEIHGYVRRNRSREDRRSVLVSLLPRGEKMLEEVAQHRISELRATGAALVNAISSLLEDRRGSLNKKESARRATKGLKKKRA